MRVSLSLLTPRALLLAHGLAAAALLSLLAVAAEAATYYVDAAAAGGDGTSWATAFRTVQAGLNAAHSGDAVEVAGGTYAENLTTKRAGVTVAGSTASGRNGPVTVKGVGNDAVLVVGHQTTWRRIAFDGSANTDGSLYVVMITAGAPTFEACVIGPGQRLLDVGDGGATFSRCTIREARLGDREYGQVVSIEAGASSAVTFSYCLFGDMEYGYIQVDTASLVNFNNCLLAGFAGAVLFLPSDAVASGGVHWQNCLAMGNGFAATAIIENNSTVAVTLTNCLVHPRTPINMADAKYVGSVTEVNPLTPASPGLTHGRRQALINLGIDDAQNIGFWTQVAAVCNAHGVQSTLALDVADATESDWATLQPLVNAGNEVAAHSAHHVYLPETRLLTLAYAGSGTGATVTVTSIGTAATTLAVAVTGDASANFSLDLTSPDYDTIGEVQAAVAARANFTCNVISVPGTSYTSAPVLSRDLGAVNGQGIQGTAATLDRNDAQFFADEIAAPKATIQARLTAPGSAEPYACDSFVYPFLGVDPTVLAYTAQAGFTAARGGYDGSYAMGGYYVSGQPGGYDVLDVWAVKPGDILGRHLDAATLQGRVEALLEWAKFTGTAISLYGHGATEYDLSEWTALLELLTADPDVRIATLRESRQYIAANAQSYSGAIYIRTVWPDVANYAPVIGSPLVRAGAAYDVAMADFGGQVVPAGVTPSVGLYQRPYVNPKAAVPAIYKLTLLQ